MAAGPRVRLLSLDCTGTLFNWSASIGTLYHRGFRRGAPGIDVPSPGAIDAQFPLAFAEVQRKWPLLGWADAVPSHDWWRAVARLAVAGSPLAEDAEAFDAGFAEVYRLFQTREAYRLHADAVPLLRWAHRVPGLRVCVISNSTESYRDAILPALGLDTYIDFGVYSKLVGVEKPDPAIFCAAARLAGVKPAEVLHVGDHARKDAGGAHAAGCQALLLDRAGTSHPPSGVDKVRSLADVRCWLETRRALGELGRRSLFHMM